MMHLFAVGEYDDILIVAERVVSVQAEFELDRAKNVVMYSNPNASPRSWPKITGSVIGLDNGTSIAVPQKPNEIGNRMSEAMTRRTVMPS